MKYTSVKGLVDFRDVKKCDFNLENSTRFFLHLTLQLRAVPKMFWMHIIPLGDHDTEKPPIWSKWDIDFSASPVKMPTDVIYLPKVDHSDFWKLFHMSKKTFRALVNHANGLSNQDGYDCDSRSLFTDNINICLCVWYLANGKCHLREALDLFRINCMEDAEDILDQGFEFLSKFLEQYIVWPGDDDDDDDEEENEVERIKTRFGDNFILTDVLGVIGHRIFMTEKKEGIFVQIVSNDQCKITAVNICYDLRLEIATKRSELYSKIQGIDRNSYLVADSEYDCFPDLQLAMPITSDCISEIDPAKRERVEYSFNSFIGELQKFVDASFMEVLARFPRLKKLHRRLPEAFITGFGLHNFCMEHEDICPEVLLQANKTFRRSV